MSVINREHYFARLEQEKNAVLRGDPAFAVGLCKAQALLLDEPEIYSAWTWISVEDRMPEDGQDVLVVYRGIKGGLTIQPHATLARFAGGRFWGDSVNLNLALVTHWAPLPPLPGEGEPHA